MNDSPPPQDPILFYNSEHNGVLYSSPSSSYLTQLVRLSTSLPKKCVIEKRRVRVTSCKANPSKFIREFTSECGISASHYNLYRTVKVLGRTRTFVSRLASSPLHNQKSQSDSSVTSSLNNSIESLNLWPGSRVSGVHWGRRLARGAAISHTFKVFSQGDCHLRGPNYYLYYYYYYYHKWSLRGRFAQRSLCPWNCSD